MPPEGLAELEAEVWWALSWPSPDAPWRAWRSSLGFMVLESPALLTHPDSLSCLRALQLGLVVPWRLPARMVLREQSLHLQVARDHSDSLSPDSLAQALLEDLHGTQALLAQWGQEEPEPSPEQDDEAAADPQALQAMGAVLALLEQDPELGPLVEFDEDSAELSLGGAEDEDWLILMRPLPSGPQALKVAVMMPQALLPDAEPALAQCLQQHLQGHDALQIGPTLHWVADAGGQQLFLQALLDPQTCTLEQLRLLLARMLALDAELSGEGGTPPTPTADSLHLFLSGLRA